jgi:hypothetical protein
MKDSITTDRKTFHDIEILVAELTPVSHGSRLRFSWSYPTPERAQSSQTGCGRACSTVSLRQGISVYPLPVFEDFYRRDRMNLPKRRPELSNLCGVLRIEQRPTSDANRGI